MTTVANINKVRVNISGARGPRGPKGDPGGNSMSIGTFDDASDLTIANGVDLVQVSGTTTPGDGGAGRLFVYDATIDQDYVDDNPDTSFLSDNGRGFREVVDTISVLKFPGVNNDDSTDCTSGLTIAHALAVSRHLKLIYPSGGIYRISDWVPVPQGNRFTIVGDGLAEIRQMTRGKGFMKFMDENTWQAEVGNFRLIMGDGTVSCASVADEEDVIMIRGTGTAGAGFYDNKFYNLRNLNGRRGLTLPSVPGPVTIGLWSTEVSRIFMESLSIGSAIRLTGMAGGYPNLKIETIYDFADVRLEPTVAIDNVSILRLSGVERNKAGWGVTNTPHLISVTGCRGFQIEGIRVENEKYKGTIAGTGLIRIANSYGWIKNFQFEDPVEFDVFSHVSMVSLFNNSNKRYEVELDHFGISQQNSNAIGGGGMGSLPDFTNGVLYMVDVLTSGGSPQAAIMGKNLQISSYQGKAFVDNRADNIRSAVQFPHINSIVARAAGVTGSPNFSDVTDIGGKGVSYKVSRRMTLVGMYISTPVTVAGGKIEIYAYKNGSAIGTGAYQAEIAIAATTGQRNVDAIYQLGTIAANHHFEQGDELQFKVKGTGISSTGDVAIEAFMLS